MKKKSKLQKKLDDPNSSLYRRKADKIWKELVYMSYMGRCAICGSGDWTQSHHYIPRELYSHRHILQNGILLCAAHHRFSFILSPHKAPISFAKWMITHHNETWKWLLEQEPTRHNTITFKDTAHKLMEIRNAMERQRENQSLSQKIYAETS
jgi:hypothetical protein